MAGSSALVEQRVWPYERAAQLYVRYKRNHEHGDLQNEQQRVWPLNVYTILHYSELKA